MECYAEVVPLHRNACTHTNAYAHTLHTRARANTHAHTQVLLHRARPACSSSGRFSSVYFMHACRLEVNIW
jgi:hypothetical protein